jgi:prophage maintenance system killer protein
VDRSQTRVRDAGILVAVVARARGAFMGRLVYRTRLDQAAALMHGIECWRPLTFWNSGLAWGTTIGFLERDGFRLAMPVKEQMLLTVDLQDGVIDSVHAVAERLAPHLELAP